MCKDEKQNKKVEESMGDKLQEEAAEALSDLFFEFITTKNQEENEDLSTK